MQRIVSVIPRDSKLMLLSDIHGGTIYSHEKGTLNIIDYIDAGRDVRWIHLGDAIEAITSDDRRFRIETITQQTPQLQAHYQVELFKRIASKGLGQLAGNHERALFRVANFAEQICNDLGIPYGTGMCRFIFFDNQGRHLFNLFACHGYWLFKSKAKDPEQELANKKASLKMRLKKLMGDSCVMVCGHAHELIAVEPVNQLYLTDEPSGVRQHYLTLPENLSGYIPVDQRFYGCTGSLRKNQMDGFDDYAEGFPPSELGCLELTVTDGRPVALTPFKV